EYLQIVATKRPVDDIVRFFGGFSPGSIFACSPAGRQAVEQLDRVKDIIARVVPEDERAFDFTSFEVVSGAPPRYGTLVVETTPPFAQLYVDDIFRGWTPKTLTLPAGWLDVLIRKSGYQDWSRRIYLVAGRTRTLRIPLQPAVTNRPPVAQIAFTPLNPLVGQPVTFNGISSYDPDGVIVDYRWDFDGDGVFDAAGPIVAYTYTSPGTYNVKLLVTDNMGATDEEVVSVNVSLPNRPPVARFSASPTPALVGSPVTFDASASYDPDGFITDYRWDFNGDGTIDGIGRTVFYTYFTAGTYQVTLYVTDNMGATAQVTQTLQVVIPGPPGMPNMNGIPGVYVWGIDRWNITVNGSPDWTTPHAYRIELRTDGTFVDVSTEFGPGPRPLGLVPEPTEEGWKLVFEGQVVSERITYSFRVRNATSIYFEIQFDTDGDGIMETSPGIVKLRQLMVNPPYNPFVVGLPTGYSGPFVPSIDFKIGKALIYTQQAHFIFWITTIEELEGGAI
ncbi:TPA: PKD domain-containing protein, partial [Candidatus Micrarchaeota archaeon]|nr:PKD domain-containing protein [Candidatus Micrarchaeota archaeon]